MMPIVVPDMPPPPPAALLLVAEATADAFTGTLAVSVDPGTDAATEMLKLDVAALVTLRLADAKPVLLVVAVTLNAPVLKLAPVNCGIPKLTTMPATGTSLSSVTFTTTSELALPFFARRNLLASSTMVSLYLPAAGGEGACHDIARGARVRGIGSGLCANVTETERAIAKRGAFMVYR